jgi:hypothetical protein
MEIRENMFAVASTGARLKVSVTLFLILFFFLVFTPRPAEAQYSVVVVGGPGSLAQIATVGELTALLTKEGVGDSLAYAVANFLLEQMARSTINWINSGFDGNPAFITDLQGFLLEQADIVAGAFIEGAGLSLLCAPFELDIRLALALNYGSPFEQQISCRLSDVVQNIDGFLEGNFEDGGWPGWFELTLRDNPYTRYIEAEHELAVRLRNNRGEQLEVLSWGQGFLSWEECETEAGTGNESCTTATPGSLIQNEVSDALGIGRDRLTIADEINEIIGALIGQLAQQALGGSGGLRGASRGSAGQPSFVDRLAAQSAADSLASARSETIEPIQETRGHEVSHRTQLQASLASVTSVEALNNNLRLCNSSQAAFYDASITPTKNSLSSRINTVNQNIDTLNGLEVRAQGASTLQGLQAILQEFFEQRINGTFSTAAAAAQAQLERQEIETRMNALQSEISNDLAGCPSPDAETFNN